MQLLRSIFFYFIVYSFLGWIIEGLFNLYTKGCFLKPNFLLLPIKPMYGIAATLLIYIHASFSLWIFLISSLIIPTLVEYFTADLLFRFYNLKYWDYSKCSYQHHGYVCLRFSIYWFFLAIMLTYGLHPWIACLYSNICCFWHYFSLAMLLIFMLDFLLTLRNTPLTK